MLPQIAQLIGGGISAIAGLATGGLQARTARENTDRQNEANRELAEYQYSKDLEMWNRGNTYNSPLAQMERLKKAGLNPNLIYGSGGATTQAVNLPKYNAPTMSYNYRPPVDPLALLGAYQDFRVRQAQIKSAEAEANASDRFWMFKTTNMDMDTRLKALDVGWKGNDYSFNKGNIPTPWQKHQAQIQEQMARLGGEQILKTQAEIANTKTRTSLTQLEIDNFITNMWAKLIFGGVGAMKGLGFRK